MTASISKSVINVFRKIEIRGRGEGGLTLVTEKQMFASSRTSFDKNLSLIVNYVKS